MHFSKQYLWIILFIPFAACRIGAGDFSDQYNAMSEQLSGVKISKITPEALLQYNNQIILLDARTQEEYRISHLKDAIWVGFPNPDAAALAHLDKEMTYVIYCSVGYRSGKLGSQLKSMGFTRVYNLHGSLFGWVNANRPVYDSSGVTDRVHGFSKSWSSWLRKGDVVLEEK